MSRLNLATISMLFMPNGIVPPSQLAEADDHHGVAQYEPAPGAGRAEHVCLHADANLTVMLFNMSSPMGLRSLLHMGLPLALCVFIVGHYTLTLNMNLMPNLTLMLLNMGSHTATSSLFYNPTDSSVAICT